MVCHVERDAFPASTLVARMEDEALDQAPVWDDLTTFDGRPWRGLVDIVTAGLPCQPYSLAGDRKGHEDERALWPEFVRIVEEVEPAAVFFENVAAYLRFYGPVWAELSRMGFVHAPPLLYTAHEKGAIHGRRRLFVLATHPDRSGLQRFPWNVDQTAGQKGRPARPSSASDRPATHTAGQRGQARSDQPAIRLQTGEQDRRDAEGRDREAADSSGIRCTESGHEREPGSREHESRRFDSQPANPHSGRLTLEWSGWVFDVERQTLRHDTDRCGDGCRICGSPWEAESPILRVDHGPADWLVELRAIGNGVVPEMAASAFLELVGDAIY